MSHRRAVKGTNVKLLKRNDSTSRYRRHKTKQDEQRVKNRTNNNIDPYTLSNFNNNYASVDRNGQEAETEGLGPIYSFRKDLFRYAKFKDKKKDVDISSETKQNKTFSAMFQGYFADGTCPDRLILEDVQCTGDLVEYECTDCGASEDTTRDACVSTEVEKKPSTVKSEKSLSEKVTPPSTCAEMKKNMSANICKQSNIRLRDNVPLEVLMKEVKQLRNTVESCKRESNPLFPSATPCRRTQSSKDTCSAFFTRPKCPSESEESDDEGSRSFPFFTPGASMAGFVGSFLWTWVFPFKSYVPILMPLYFLYRICSWVNVCLAFFAILVYQIYQYTFDQEAILRGLCKLKTSFTRKKNVEPPPSQPRFDECKFLPREQPVELSNIPHDAASQTIRSHNSDPIPPSTAEQPIAQSSMVMHQQTPDKSVHYQSSHHLPNAESSHHQSIAESSHHQSISPSSHHQSVAQSSHRQIVAKSSLRQTVAKSSHHPTIAQSSHHQTVGKSSHHPTIAQSSHHQSVAKSENVNRPQNLGKAAYVKIALDDDNAPHISSDGVYENMELIQSMGNDQHGCYIETIRADGIGSRMYKIDLDKELEWSSNSDDVLESMAVLKKELKNIRKESVTNMATEFSCRLKEMPRGETPIRRFAELCGVSVGEVDKLFVSPQQIAEIGKSSWKRINSMKLGELRKIYGHLMNQEESEFEFYSATKLRNLIFLNLEQQNEEAFLQAWNANMKLPSGRTIQTVCSEFLYSSKPNFYDLTDNEVKKLYQFLPRNCEEDSTMSVTDRSTFRSESPTPMPQSESASPMAKSESVGQLQPTESKSKVLSTAKKSSQAIIHTSSRGGIQDQVSVSSEQPPETNTGNIAMEMNEPTFEPNESTTRSSTMVPGGSTGLSPIKTTSREQMPPTGQRSSTSKPSNTPMKSSSAITKKSSTSLVTSKKKSKEGRRDTKDHLPESLLPFEEPKTIRTAADTFVDSQPIPGRRTVPSGKRTHITGGTDPRFARTRTSPTEKPSQGNMTRPKSIPPTHAPQFARTSLNKRLVHDIPETVETMTNFDQSTQASPRLPSQLWKSRNPGAVINRSTPGTGSIDHRSRPQLGTSVSETINVATGHAPFPGRDNKTLSSRPTRTPRGFVRTRMNRNR
ncbi:hypothetical protein SNEBB_009066 [Seison nebaliae]|nr:hypothetical protein SNEBB_009066 [Seison nebaliae]